MSNIPNPTSIPNPNNNNNALLSSKVGCLGDVEAVIEPLMIGIREGDDDLHLFLNRRCERDAILLEELGRDEAHLVTQEVGAPAETNPLEWSCSNGDEMCLSISYPESHSGKRRLTNSSNLYPNLGGMQYLGTSQPTTPINFNGSRFNKNKNKKTYQVFGFP